MMKIFGLLAMTAAVVAGASIETGSSKQSGFENFRALFPDSAARIDAARQRLANPVAARRSVRSVDGSESLALIEGRDASQDLPSSYRQITGCTVDYVLQPLGMNYNESLILQNHPKRNKHPKNKECGWLFYDVDNSGLDNSVNLECDLMLEEGDRFFAVSLKDDKFDVYDADDSETGIVSYLLPAAIGFEQEIGGRNMSNIDCKAAFVEEPCPVEFIRMELGCVHLATLTEQLGFENSFCKSMDQASTLYSATSTDDFFIMKDYVDDNDDENRLFKLALEKEGDDWKWADGRVEPISSQIWDIGSPGETDKYAYLMAGLKAIAAGGVDYSYPICIIR